MDNPPIEPLMRHLRWAADSVTGQPYQPSPVQVHFRGLFTPSPIVEVVGTFSETDFLEAELIEIAGSGESVIVYRALDGCLIRLMKRWENKQFNGSVAIFSRLKVLWRERGKHYRLRITWLEKHQDSFRVVSFIDTLSTFQITAHAPATRHYSANNTRKRSASIDEQRLHQFSTVPPSVTIKPEHPRVNMSHVPSRSAVPTCSASSFSFSPLNPSYTSTAHSGAFSGGPTVTSSSEPLSSPLSFAPSNFDYSNFVNEFEI